MSRRTGSGTPNSEVWSGGFGVAYYHDNPGSTSWVETTSAFQQAVVTRQERDPLRAETGEEDPFAFYGEPSYADA